MGVGLLVGRLKRSFLIASVSVRKKITEEKGLVEVLNKK